MRSLPDRLVAALRNTGGLPQHAGAEPRYDEISAVVELPQPAYRYDETRPSQLVGLRIDRRGQISVWWTLPRDGVGGGILNEAELSRTFAQHLRLIRVLGVSEPTRYALAVGVTGSMISVVEGTLPEVSRSSAHFG